MFKYLSVFNKNKEMFKDLECFEEQQQDEKHTCVVVVEPECEKVKCNRFINKIFFWKKEKTYLKDCQA
jgi:hypothetical protein